MDPTHVATLVAHAAELGLTHDLLRRLMQAVPNSVAEWLEPGIAVDLSFGAAAPAAVETEIRHILAGVAVDVIVQPIAARRKKLLLADMDSTMIGQECLDELADFAGLRSEVAAITERAMRGEIAFGPA